MTDDATRPETLLTEVTKYADLHCPWCFDEHARRVPVRTVVIGPDTSAGICGDTGHITRMAETLMQLDRTAKVTVVKVTAPHACAFGCQGADPAPPSSSWP